MGLPRGDIKGEDATSSSSSSRFCVSKAHKSHMLQEGEGQRDNGRGTGTMGEGLRPHTESGKWWWGVNDGEGGCGGTS